MVNPRNNTAKYKYLCSDGVMFESIFKHRKFFAVVFHVGRFYYNSEQELEQALAGYLKDGYIVDTGTLVRIE